MFVIIMGALLRIPPFVSPSPLGVAREAMDEYEASQSAKYTTNTMLRGLL